MSDLIDRQAALDALGDVHPLDYNAIAVRNRIISLPAAEPERKNGEWLMISDFPDRLICSECGAQFDVWLWESKQMHFCPNCGAEMG